MSNIYSVTHYRKLLKVDMYLKGLINIGYNFKVKGASYSWGKLTTNQVNNVNIAKRDAFYVDKRIPKQHRSNTNDYIRSGYDRGHLMSDASYDDNTKDLHAVYKLSNIVPQAPHINRHVWFGFEKYSRDITTKLKYTYVINIMLYKDKVITNNVGVPHIMYKIIINKKHKFLKIFRVQQDSTVKGLEPYISDVETLKKEIKIYHK